MTLFHGLSAFPITPSDGNGRVDTDAVERLTARLALAKVDSIGLLGSTGTYVYLNRAERLRAIQAAVSAANGTPLIAGIGTFRTDDVVAHAQDAQQAGIDGLLLAPVSYTPLTTDEVLVHFETVAKSTDLPICIYNNPGTTHFHFTPELLQRLADIRNIKAVKMPLPAAGPIAADLAHLRKTLPPGFAIGYSGDWGCAEALQAGADAWFSVLGGTLPDIALKLTRDAQAGDTSKNKALEPLWALFQEHGSLRVVYAISKYLKLTNAAPPRPILPLGSEAETQVINALEALGTTVG
jgi:4-hydroxy-tetrahydrodipicolinate synthase